MLVSIILVKVLRAQGHIAVFICAILGVKIDITVIMFVDDTDLISTVCPNVPVPQMLECTQAAINTWHGSLRAMGEPYDQTSVHGA